MKYKKSLLVTSLLLAMVGCSQKSSETLFTEAQQLAEKKQWAQATIELKNALKQEPEFAEARLLLADIYFQSGNFVFAEKEYLLAIEHNADLNKVLPNLFSTYIGLFKFEDVLLFDIDGLDGLSPEVIDAHNAYQVIALINMADSVAAKSIEINSDGQSKYKLLHQAYIASLDNRETALEKLDAALDLDGKFSDAIFLKAILQTAKLNYSAAISSWEAYLELKPSHSIASLYLADTHNLNGQHEEASEIINKYLKKYPNSPTAKQIRAFSYFELDKYEEAYLDAEFAYQNGLTSDGIRLLAGYSAFRTNKLEQALNYLEPVAEKLGKNHPVHRAYMLTQYKLGKNTDIIDTIDVEDGLDSIENQLLAASAYRLLANNDSHNAELAIDKLSQNSNLNRMQKFQLALLKFSTNDKNAGIELLESAQQDDPTALNTSYALAKAYLQDSEFEKANHIAKQLVNSEHQAHGYLLESEILEKQGNLDDALVSIDRAISLSPASYKFRIIQSRLLKQLGRINEAAEVVIKQLNQKPDIPVLYVELYKLEAISDIEKRSLKQLSSYVETNPEQHQLKLTLTQLLLEEGRLQEAYSVISSISPDHLSAPAVLMAQKSKLEIQLEQFSEADKTYKDWVSIEPNNPQARLQQIIYYDMVGNSQAALDASQRAYVKFADNDAIAMLNAHLLLRSGNVNSANKIYKASSDRAKMTTVGKQVYGNILVLNNKTQDGLRLLLETHDEFTNHYNIGLIVYAYQKLDSRETAIVFLDKYLGSNPNDLKSRFLLANELMLTNPKRAITEYALILENTPNSLLALNNIAYLYQKEGELETADKYISQAVTQAPNNINILDTAADIKLGLNLKAEAIILLESALKIDPNNQKIKNKLNSL
ncbi:PEP-CTERM system TPR-repeat protein PrsT [Psychrosphaera sp.]|nr:PEP-CTERM system TPR-repeat protein PrsT [Psychrosphaera sp.]